MRSPCPGLLGTLFLVAFAGPIRADDAPTFERDVRPILKAYCLDCHGAEAEPKGSLDLRLRRTAAGGGASGPALVPGAPDESVLLTRMQDGEMPPGEKKVPPEQIAIVARWIEAGAPTLRDEPATLPPGINITPEDRAFWAFQPIRRVDPPTVPDAQRDQVRTPIDAFLLATLRERGRGFNPEADRRTLIRRLTADLTGLPPSPEQVEAFVADPAPDAYERLVDRLLADPAYGERWGRHWLDVAGYADSDGNPDDAVRPYAYKYRDYVIRAFNADMPLDQFVTEQLAGDELVPRPWVELKPDQIETLAATGFLRTVVDGTSTGGVDEALAANQVVADALKVVGSTLLGLTVGCAQCHDHRYDPIPQIDYYRMRAVFEPALDPNHWRRPGQRLVSLATDADRARSAAIEAEAKAMEEGLAPKVRRFLDAALEKELTKYPEEQRGPLGEASRKPASERTDEQKALLAANPSADISEGVLYQYNQAAADELKKDREVIAAKRAEKPVEDYVAVLDEVPGVVPETRRFHRGDHRQPLEAVGAGGDLTITAVDGPPFEVPSSAANDTSSGRRLAYARHLMSGTHPLVGRVLVNRVWLHHFGRGLVDSPGDFGALGQKPTHPDLLDWLADELARRGWSLKQLQRLIVTSSAYRQSSLRDPTADDDEALYAHFPLRRLEAEAMRDRLLAVSGRLDRRPYGPAVAVVEDTVGQTVPEGDSARRGVYLQFRRTKPESFLTTFDAPVMAVNCDRRTPSNSALQALMLMNSETMIGYAKAMAARIVAEVPGEEAGAGVLDGRIARAWSLAYQRPIEPDELEAAREFVASSVAASGAAEAERTVEALTNLCHQLLSSNEFFYVD